MADDVTWPTMPRIREASGARHSVGEGQLFFSMTDRRGVITAANSVFVELARFSREELMGSPHSIIRHPSMPSGVFKLMWDEILAGRPFACYINNLARDGSTYTVFATIAPAANGMFLSVRSRPLRRDLLRQALAGYQATRDVELVARDHGVNRRGMAAIGLDKMNELLVESGWASYEEFEWNALVAEAEARAAVPSGLQTRPEASGPLAHMLICCHTLSAELRRWSGHQAAIANMARSLAEATPHLSDAAASATTTATSLRGAHLGERPRSLEFLVSRLAKMSSIIGVLVGHLIEFRHSCQDTRTWVALAELHTAALSQFVVEILDSGLAAYDRDAINQVCQALDFDFTQVSELSEQNASYAATMIHELGRAHALIADHQSVVAQLAGEVGPGDARGGLLPRIREELATVEAALALIAHLGREATTVVKPQDTRLAEFQVARLLELMDSLT